MDLGAHSEGVFSINLLVIFGCVTLALFRHVQGVVERHGHVTLLDALLENVKHDFPLWHVLADNVVELVVVEAQQDPLVDVRQRRATALLHCLF